MSKESDGNDEKKPAGTVSPKDVPDSPKDEPAAPDAAPAPGDTASEADAPAEPADAVPEDAPKDDAPAVPAVPKSGGSAKPVNRGMYAALLATVAAAAFFAGLSAPILNQDPIEMSDLNQAVLFLEDKIDRLSDEVRTLENRMLTDPESSVAPPVVPSADDDPSMGSDTAPVTIIEFSDYQCPFCARFYAETLPMIKSEYIDTGIARLVYRDFPLQNIHPNAVAAAVAAECADDQGAYWDYHDTLFETIQMWNGLDTAAAVEEFKAYASDLGIETETFGECLDSGKYIQEVASDYSDGVSYGVEGTPAFFVGNEQAGYLALSGALPFPEFSAAIERILSITSQ